MTQEEIKKKIEFIESLIHSITLREQVRLGIDKDILELYERIQEIFQAYPEVKEAYKNYALSKPGTAEYLLETMDPIGST